MTTTLAIFGTSGCAKDIADIVYDIGWSVVYVARDEAERAACHELGEIIVESEIERYADMQFAIGIGDNAVRQKVFARYAGRLRFPSLMHPSATFGHRQRDLVTARQGVVVSAGVRLTNHITVGDFTMFNLNCTVAHDVVVEDFATIAPGANVSGNVSIGARSWIGAGAVINQGTAARKLRIGPDTVIGSGAVVIRDCDAGAVYAGVPAKRIK